MFVLMVVYERSAFLAPGEFFGPAGMWLATKTKLTRLLIGLLQRFSTGNQKVGELTRGRFTLKGTVKIEAAEAEQSRLSVASKGQAPTTPDPTLPKTQWAFRSIPTQTFSLKLLALFENGKGFKHNLTWFLNFETVPPESQRRSCKYFHRWC